jgi:anti-anti-sigma factor
MEISYVLVSSVARVSSVVITVSGELTLVSEREFTARVTEALAASQGPVVFDVSGLEFMDCRGARALAWAVHAASPRETGVLGCSAAGRRILGALGFDLPHRLALTAPVPARQRPLASSGARSRGESLTAMTSAAESNMRQSALYTSAVMSRLAATYSQLALNSRYRTQGKSEDRGRLLALSGRALDLSRLCQSHAGSGAD